MRRSEAEGQQRRPKRHLRCVRRQAVAATRRERGPKAGRRRYICGPRPGGDAREAAGQLGGPTGSVTVLSSRQAVAATRREPDAQRGRRRYLVRRDQAQATARP
jgi:hypothetical protein